MYLKPKNKGFIILLAIFLFTGCTDKVEKGNSHTLSFIDCKACDRLILFSGARDIVGKSIWNGLNKNAVTPPLLYFTDSTTYLAFSDRKLFEKEKHRSICCNDELTLHRLEQRIDDQPFHMENKMSFSDSSSPYYYTPAMLCSDVETMHQFVPDFKTTEEWLQLVMHEYFHSFQFSHDRTINYLADTIRIAADTLDKIYLTNDQFRQGIKYENQLLIKAFQTGNADSLNWYINEFLIHRENRRSEYKSTFGFDLREVENFWETIEGTARYVEYEMAMNFTDITLDEPIKCDSLFNDFSNYSSAENLKHLKEFKQRTMIMPAYYYVTGFNLCRLMDKLGYEYKRKLFNNPRIGLYEIFLNARRI